MLVPVFSLIALLCLSPTLSAQTETTDRYQVYGGYTYLSNSFNGVPGARQPLNGWDASVAFPAWHSLRFKIDAFGYIGTNLNAPQHVYFIMGGGQYGRHFGREFTYVEALVGDGGINSNWGANATSGETASFATLLGGGLDSPITRRLAFRIDAGYQWSNFALAPPPTLPNIPYRIPGLPNNFARISTGCVWRFH
jgi:hypothetical protein